LFPTQDDLRASAVSFTRSVAGRATGPATTQECPVQVRLFDGTSREAETAAIIQRIADLKVSEPKSSIAVLVASRSHAAPIITGLEARKIDAVGVDLVPLRELSIVRDLVALMQATGHLGDRTAWLAVLRAPWCGLSLATLTILSHRRDTLLVWEAMADEQRLARCPAEEITRVIRVRGVLEAAMRARNSMPLADWLELTWLRLGAADAYAARDLRHARAFFSALSERVAGGEWSGPQDLDSLLGDLYAQPQSTESNPVQLMTIHRAKGLEFDHVFVPCLDRDLNRGREPLLRWLDLPRAEGQSDLIMAPVPAIGDDEGGEVSAYLKRLISRRAVNEQTRLLYVAATRAKQTLQLSAAPKAKADGTISPRYGTLLASLWPAVGPMLAADAAALELAQLGEADAGARAAAERITFDPVVVGTAEHTTSGDSGSAAPAPPLQPLRRLISTWSLPTLTTTPDLPHLPISHQSLEPPEFSWVGETARHIGTVVHAVLEQYAGASELPSKAAIEAEREFYVYQLRRHGVPEGDLSRAASVVLEALTRTVSNERGRWIFAPEHSESRSEWALTGIAAGRLTNVVIDRSFIDKGGTRWVIDFKTSRHEGGGLELFLEQEMTRYRPQLETYVALARGMGTAPIRAGLYFPLLDVFREMT
jgi:ATP-dependent helicase/nuclease subunit A